MAIRDNYGYENAKYAMLKQPSIDVTSAFGRANHFLDTIQEGVYIEAAMPYTSRYIHNVAHKMLKWLDDFSDILHERHLMTIYPPVPQLDEDVRDMNRVFEIVIQIFDEVQEALESFHSACETSAMRPLAIKTENLMMDVSAEYTNILAMANMWERGVSHSSYDNWVLHLMTGDGNGED